MSKKRPALFVAQEYDDLQIAYGLAEIELKRAGTDGEKAKIHEELEMLGQRLTEVRREMSTN